MNERNEREEKKTFNLMAFFLAKFPALKQTIK
jgi:hypothetical protein